jgi:hypothetical protein
MDKMFTKAAKLLPPNIQKIYGGDGGQWVGLKAIFLFCVCGRVVGPHVCWLMCIHTCTHTHTHVCVCRCNVCVYQSFFLYLFFIFFNV